MSEFIERVGRWKLARRVWGRYRSEGMCEDLSINVARRDDSHFALQ